MKLCVRCKTEQPKDQFKKGKNADGLFSYCKHCVKEASTKHRRKIGIAPRSKPQTPSELPEFKICTKCKKNKENAAFRVRHKNKNEVLYYHLSPMCKECEIERAKIYYDSKKNDADFKRKNIERYAAYVNKNMDQIKKRRQTVEYLKKHSEWESKRYAKCRDVICAKNKVKRQTPEYKAMMKAYRTKNKEKINAQEKITKLRYQEKNRDGLTDKYISGVLISNGVATKEILKQYPEIIEAKRLQILIIRKTRNNGNQNNVGFNP